jgi:hypothetical protein
MLKVLLFASFAHALVSEIFESALEDGYLYHAIDFTSQHSPEHLVQHWNDNGWYMDSFSYLNAISPKCAGNLGVLVDPKHPSVTAHLIGNDNLMWKDVRNAISITGQTWSDACDNTNLGESTGIQRAVNDREMSRKITSINDCYDGRLTGNVKPHFTKEKIIFALRKNERQVNEYSEIVTSASFDAVRAIIFGPRRLRTKVDNWRAPEPSRGTLEYASRLCKAARGVRNDIECIFLDPSNEFRPLAETWQSDVYGNPIPLSYFPETPQLPRTPTELPCKANVENLPVFIDGEDGDDCLNVDHGSTCQITRPNMRCVEHFCNNGNFFPKQVTCIPLHVDGIVTENSDLQNANRALKEESQKELKRLEDENIDSLRGIADLKEIIELEKERLKRAVVEKEAIEEEKVRLQRENDKMIGGIHDLNDAKDEAERVGNLLQEEHHQLIRVRNNLRSEKQSLIDQKTNVENEKNMLHTERSHLVREKNDLRNEKAALEKEKASCIRDNARLSDEKAMIEDELQEFKDRADREKNDLIQVNGRLGRQKQALFDEKINLEKEKETIEKEDDSRQDSLHKTKTKLHRQNMILYIWFPSAAFVFVLCNESCVS